MKTNKEIIEEFWNSKPKKIVTGEGVVASLNIEELTKILETKDQEREQAVTEARTQAIDEAITVVGEMHMPFGELAYEPLIVLLEALKEKPSV
jgi:hypothetical protein